MGRGRRHGSGDEARRARDVRRRATRESAPPFQVEAATVSPHAAAQFNSYSHSFCGMTLQYLLFWGMESGLLLLRERQRGVWTRVRAAPVPLSCVIAGKALATAAIALLQVLVTFGFGYVAFGVDDRRLGDRLRAARAGRVRSGRGDGPAGRGDRRNRSPCPEREHPGDPRRVDARRAVGAGVPAARRGCATLSLSLPTTWAMRGLER